MLIFLHELSEAAATVDAFSCRTFSLSHLCVCVLTRSAYTTQHMLMASNVAPQPVTYARRATAVVPYVIIIIINFIRVNYPFFFPQDYYLMTVFL